MLIKNNRSIFFKWMFLRMFWYLKRSSNKWLIQFMTMIITFSYYKLKFPHCSVNMKVISQEQIGRGRCFFFDDGFPDWHKSVLSRTNVWRYSFLFSHDRTIKSLLWKDMIASNSFRTETDNYCYKHYNTTPTTGSVYNQPSKWHFITDITIYSNKTHTPQITFYLIVYYKKNIHYKSKYIQWKSSSKG